MVTASAGAWGRVCNGRPQATPVSGRDYLPVANTKAKEKVLSLLPSAPALSRFALLPGLWSRMLRVWRGPEWSAMQGMEGKRRRAPSYCPMFPLDGVHAEPQGVLPGCSGPLAFKSRNPALGSPSFLWSSLAVHSPAHLLLPLVPEAAAPLGFWLSHHSKTCLSPAQPPPRSAHRGFAGPVSGHRPLASCSWQPASLPPTPPSCYTGTTALASLYLLLSSVHSLSRPCSPRAVSQPH